MRKIRKMKAIFLFILISMLLVGCGAKGDPEDNGDISKQEDIQKDSNNTGQQDVSAKDYSGYFFEDNNVKIYMNTDVVPVVGNLGQASEYFESESCAFKGLDKFYFYSGFEISTYPMDGKDFISAVDLVDDTVSTPEGIYLGSTVEDMIAAYGEDYNESLGSYSYIKDDSNLQFITEDGEVIGITYFAIVDGLE